MSITIKGVTKQNTAYDKQVTFERDGVEYFALLHWDSYDGYYLSFNGKDPDWADEWDEEKEGDTLESILDQLTDEAIEESYL